MDRSEYGEWTANRLVFMRLTTAKNDRIGTSKVTEVFRTQRMDEKNLAVNEYEHRKVALWKGENISRIFCYNPRYHRRSLR